MSFAIRYEDKFGRMQMATSDDPYGDLAQLATSGILANKRKKARKNALEAQIFALADSAPITVDAKRLDERMRSLTWEIA